MNNFTLSIAQSLVESQEKFPVDFDELWQWCGYSNKENAKKRLVRNFEQNYDFIQMDEPTTTGISANPRKIISLSVNAAKEFAMLSQTKQGKQVRRYFLEVEKKYLQSLDIKPKSSLDVIQAMIDNLREQEKAINQNTKAIAHIRAETERIVNPDGGMFTIRGYASNQNVRVGIHEAKTLGRRAAKLSKKLGAAIEKIDDPRYGKVNVYREDILQQIFTDTDIV